MAIQIYICEDNVLFSRELAGKLPKMGDFAICGMADCAEGALADPLLGMADVLLLDLEMPGMGGLLCINELLVRDHFPEILVLTTTAEEDIVYRAIRNGAAGYLLKSAGLKKISRSILDVYEGGCVIDAFLAARFWNYFISAQGKNETNYDLTAEEIDLLDLLARGLSNPELGSALGKKRTNIKKMLARIYRKMQVSSRVDAVRLAVQSGLVKL